MIKVSLNFSSWLFISLLPELEPLLLRLAETVSELLLIVSVVDCNDDVSFFNFTYGIVIQKRYY